MSARPIFIMSSERSGSNLLRKLLGNHSAIAGPVAPHFLRTIFVNEAKYRDAGLGLEQMFADTLAVANHRKHGWNVGISFAEFESRYRPQCYLDVFDGLYQLMQERDQASFVVCKENEIFEHAEALYDYYGDSGLFIYLHRDPRDYAWSWMRMPFMFSTPAQAARFWLREQRQCLDVERRFPETVVRIGFETLLADVRQPIDAVLNRLGLDAEPGCYDPSFAKSTAEDTEFVFFKNLDKPIRQDVQGKSRSGFDADALYQIEDIALPVMVELGYAPHFSHGPLTSLVRRVGRALKGADPARFKTTEHDAYSDQLVRDWAELYDRLRNQFD